MTFSIGLRFYRISIRKKGDKEPLEIGPGCEPCDLLDYVEDFVARKTEPTVETTESRTWFFERLDSNSLRAVHGFINYGTHGFESKLKDVTTKEEKYKRESTDLEEIPLYFQIWMPSSTNYALMAFQSFQGRSCVQFVQSAMSADFQDKFKGHNLSFKVIAPAAALLDTAPVKSVTFLKPKQSSDRADKYWLGKKMDELDYEVTVRAHKRSAFISMYKDLKELVPSDQGGFVEFDGVTYEGVKADIKMGKKRRSVGIFGSGIDAGLIDVSDNVKRDKSGHPTLNSIVAEVDSLMEDFFASIKM
ncbi:hypothetical protein [Phyllobacterium sp. OV277]|uniref:hypothetical protein n=1 Tax=Phyllobacterium sp. OV277 TaxID=1882772 RepID=UPI000880D501|nr:hypothetical protein [Phyllobacterium sp. OV277]SDP08929.1 hypothetical protein SAMN05443582_103371 [Phyllobacterium sp. OV277]